jgi:hypothetical protein
MRALHRDIGFFVIGLTFIYSISGMLLIYRDTDFLKSEKIVERQLQPNMEVFEIGNALHQRGMEVQKEDAEILYFRNGTYNKVTGVAKYTEKSLPVFLEKFNNLHKKASGSLSHYLSVIFGVALLFLAISSFWMYSPKSKLFRRGLILAGTGIISSVIFLFL